jgi:hypothetical protein
MRGGIDVVLISVVSPCSRLLIGKCPPVVFCHSERLVLAEESLRNPKSLRNLLGSP